MRRPHIAATVKDEAVILVDKTIQIKPALVIIFFRNICMKIVFGFQQKGSLLFLFTSMAEVKSVEKKQC